MASPKLWMDAYLAAFAIAGGCQLVTTDQGFAQFPSLRCLLSQDVRELESLLADSVHTVTDAGGEYTALATPLCGRARVARFYLRATLNRSSGEPEELAAGYGIGYFHLVWNRSAGLSRNILGGPGKLVEALASGLEGRIRLGAEVTQVVADRDGVLVHYREGGVEAAGAYVDRLVAGLKLAMVLTGSRDLETLGRAPVVLGGRLRDWLVAEGGA